ncbi:AraC family transcriptional regulator [Aquimarina agarilytica]|uniref:AraC family transcriptional regulator n=1 Tax=Aquimarina agarilytica TaxID=1087449 RepID=UPI0002895D2E|nr:helix-turn-helix domain-containing protein [Aquimarina agarilytica]
MKSPRVLPVFNIANFKDYCDCMDFDSNFYIRKFSDHVKENLFIEKPHAHDFYLMLLVTKGAGKHYIDFKEYEVHPGAMFVLAPGLVHRWNMSKDIDGYILFFTKKYFMLDFKHDNLSRFPFFKKHSSVPYIRLTKKHTKEVYKFYELMNKEYHTRDLDYHEMIRMYLNTILIRLSRKLLGQKSAAYAYNYEIVQLNTFEELIETYFIEHKPIGFYSDAMNLSTKQLSHICKKLVAKVPSELLMDRIILEAKRLIIYTDLSINQISIKLNYSDSSYFVRLFKKMCNQTPEQFRSFKSKTQTKNLIRTL